MFNFNFDKRTMYIIIGIMLVFLVIQYATNPSQLLGLLLSAPGVLIAITFHEFAHGYAAYKLGDDTAKRQGRLSLNPFAHLDPIGTLMLLVAGFGWGKPVEVDPRNYTRKISMEKGEAIVSLAGPLMNFILAIIFTLIYCAIYKFASATFMASTVGIVIMLLLSSTISINIGLGVFNLIPLPPLDGSNILYCICINLDNRHCWYNNNTCNKLGFKRSFSIRKINIWIIKKRDWGTGQKSLYFFQSFKVDI